MTNRKQVYPHLRVPYLRLMCDDTRRLYVRDLLDSAYESEKQIRDAVEVIRQLTKGTDLTYRTEYEKIEGGMFMFVR